MKHSRSSHNRAASPSKLSAQLAVAVLALCALGFAQPFPSFPIEESVPRGATSLDVSGTRVAFGPDVGLLVWIEGKTLRGARIDRHGSLLDTVPIDIDGPAAPACASVRPAVCWGEGRFMAVWCEVDRAMCALIQADGSVSGRVVLQDSIPSVEGTTAAAFDGSNFLAAWTGSVSVPRFVRQAFFRRVSPSGSTLDSSAQRVAPGCTLPHRAYDLAYSQGKYLALWRNALNYGLWASFIMPDGTVPDSQGFQIRPGGSIQFGSVTHDSRNFVVAWNESPYRVSLARVTDDGQLLDTAGVVIDTFAPWWTDLVSTGDTTLVVFCRDSVTRGDSLRVVAVRVDTALRTLDSMPVFLSPPDSSHGSENGPCAPAVALCGDDYLAAWAQPYWANGKLTNHVAMYRRLNRQGQLLDSASMLASYSPYLQGTPRVATDGTGFLAVWIETSRDSTGQMSSVYGARFNAGGTVLDSQPLLLGGREGSRAQWPRVAYGGGCYLVVWSNGVNAYAARVSPGGVLLDSMPFRLNGSRDIRYFADVAFGDSIFLAAWSEAADGHTRGVRISPSGRLLDSVSILLQGDNTRENLNPQIAFGGVNFLVVRTDAYPAVFRAVRVSTAGRVLDPDDITISAAPHGAMIASMAYGEGVYVVTSDLRNMSWRVSRFGVLLDSVSHAYSGPKQPVFDGANFLVLCNPDSLGNLTAMRISPDGDLLDSVPFPFVAAVGTASAARAGVAINDNGIVGLVFQSFDPEPWFADRVRAAVIPSLAVIDAGAVVPAVSKPIATVIRGVLAMPDATTCGPQAASLLDISGRKALELHWGANDVSRLPPGVYFIREEPRAASRKLPAVRKVVIAR